MLTPCGGVFTVLSCCCCYEEREEEGWHVHIPGIDFVEGSCEESVELGKKPCAGKEGCCLVDMSSDSVPLI